MTQNPQKIDKTMHNISLKDAEKSVIAFSTDALITRFSDLFQLDKKRIQEAVHAGKDIYLAIAEVMEIPRERVKTLAHGLMYRTGTSGLKEYGRCQRILEGK